jgi:hypothetical protein
MSVAVDLIFATLRDRVKEFVAETPYMFTNISAGTRIIRSYFPSYQYTGNGQFEEVMLWCEEHFGRDWIWSMETFYFKRESDRTVFMLRWS